MRNNDRPDLILASNLYYNYYWGSLTGIQRISGTDQGKGGFDSLKFVNADVVNEGGVGGNMNDSNGDTYYYRHGRDYVTYNGVLYSG
jgi:hypothetical protein